MLIGSRFLSSMEAIDSVHQKKFCEEKRKVLFIRYCVLSVYSCACVCFPSLLSVGHQEASTVPLGGLDLWFLAGFGK